MSFYNSGFQSSIDIRRDNEYACTEGGAPLPIAHALRLPEPTNKPKSDGGVPPLGPGPLAALRFGNTCMERRKKKKNNAKFVATTSTLRSHQKSCCDKKVHLKIFKKIAPPPKKKFPHPKKFSKKYFFSISISPKNKKKLT